MTEVYKFGGTCTRDQSRLYQISELVKNGPEKLIITLSAAYGVTNKFINLLQGKLADSKVENFIVEMTDIHQELLPKSVNKLPDIFREKIMRLEKILNGVIFTDMVTEKARDLILSFGERFIVSIFDLYLKEQGMKSYILDPEELIITDGTFNSAFVLLEDTKENLHSTITELLSQHDVLIVPGFYGTSSNGDVTLLGRSGTDYTGSVLAYSINAPSYTIWKDVHGFMSADPNEVQSARTIDALTYEEAAELAFFGASLLHPRAASPAMIADIPILIRHIDDLFSITKISSADHGEEPEIKSVTYMKNLVLLTVYTSVGGSINESLASILVEVKNLNGNLISVTTSQTTVALLFPSLEAEKIATGLQSLGVKIVDRVVVKEDLSLICVVGQNIASTPRITTDLFDILSRKEIYVDMISAGASSSAYHFTINQNYLSQALNLIHEYMKKIIK